jgi:hypothetical protein
VTGYVPAKKHNQNSNSLFASRSPLRVSRPAARLGSFAFLPLRTGNSISSHLISKRKEDVYV